MNNNKNGNHERKLNQDKREHHEIFSKSIEKSSYDFVDYYDTDPKYIL